MQTSTGWKRHWKVIAATTAVSALGLGGAAIADSRDDSNAPAPISLSEQSNVKPTTSRSLRGGASIGADQSGDLDSPFDDGNTANQQSGDNSPDADSPNVASADTFDSPDSPGTADSYDVAPAAPANPPAGDGSADSGSAGSANS